IRARTSALTENGTLAGCQRVRDRTGAVPVIGTVAERATDPGTRTPMGQSPNLYSSDRKLWFWFVISSCSPAENTLSYAARSQILNLSTSPTHTTEPCSPAYSRKRGGIKTRPCLSI